MKLRLMLLFTLVLSGLPGIVRAQLDATETEYLLLMREEEKLARDTYITMYEAWGLNTFNNISRSEQRHMDAILTQLNRFGLADPVVDDTVGVFTNPTLAAYYGELVTRGDVSLMDALHVGAYIEELDIYDLWEAIETTDEATLISTYDNLLAGSRNHLRAFVNQITSRGTEYTAQYLTQEQVDAIVGDYDLPEADFEINAGLNDAWYYPQTSGQGFFITVYPGSKTLFLSWFTFDTEQPDESATANLGSPNQRWLTAQGSYEGSQADLQVYVTGGGVFDSSDPAPVTEQDGSIVVRFEGCNSGSVTYDIPSIGQFGIVPIERIALDNVAHCENLAKNL
ncbi:MAG: DUF2202 domain-containing protein [Gammaproteobacteria bacterium]|nr:DUF2202 domain-containing protein [Gammaproteobacteria bacterium]NNK32321.1 DUF2202 domain-containing protein [Xanthomonadales bacterium]